MSTLAVVVIAIVVLIAVALLIAARRRARAQEVDDRRTLAARHRDEAVARSLMAKHEAAQARAHAEHADELDPDAERRVPSR